MPAHTAPSHEDNTSSKDEWKPFNSRVEFEFAWFHFVEIESSARNVEKALDLWAASVLESGGTSPWRTTADLYATIDEIRHGDAPWKSYSICYDGPLPHGTPPEWMTRTYELCIRDSRQVLHQQFATPEFKDKMNMTPYRQFNRAGKRVFTNLMSGDWAWKQAVYCY